MSKLLNKKLIIVLLCVAVCAMVYTMMTGHALRIVNMALIYAIVAMGISIMLGMTGMMNFSSIVFFGLGAYVVAEFTTGYYGFTMYSSPLALLCAVLVCAVVSAALGAIVLRLSGTFFAFSTIALVQIANNLFVNYKPLFGGPAGIIGVPTFSILGFSAKNHSSWFLVCAVALGVVALLVERIRVTQLGRSLASIRDDQVVAASLGINIYRTKLYAFIISSVLAGFAGGLYAMLNGYIGYEMFTYAKSTDFIVMAMIGGVNNTLGIILGSVIITSLPELFRDFADWFRLCYGVAVVLLMIFLPTGIAGIIPVIRLRVTKIVRGLRKVKTQGGKS